MIHPMNFKIIKLSISFLFLLLFQGFLSGQSRIVAVQSNIAEPFPFISGKFTGHEVAESPDPLVGYKWGETNVNDDLEIMPYIQNQFHPIFLRIFNPD